MQPVSQTFIAGQTDFDLVQVDNKKQKHSLAFASLMSFIEDSINFGDSEEKEVIFKLSELVKLYSRRLQELNVEVTSTVYSTRLKERILSQFQDMQHTQKVVKFIWLMAMLLEKHSKQ